MSEEEETERLRESMQKCARQMKKEDVIQFLAQLYSYDENGQLREKFS